MFIAKGINGIDNCDNVKRKMLYLTLYLFFKCLFVKKSDSNLIQILVMSG